MMRNNLLNHLVRPNVTAKELAGKPNAAIGDIPLRHARPGEHLLRGVASRGSYPSALPSDTARW